MKELGYTSLFLTQFVRNPLRVGSVLPSSALLARSVIPVQALAGASLVVELGPGTGVITRELVRMKPAQCRYLGVELNTQFLRVLRRRFPEQQFHHGDAAALGQILQILGYGKADVIVSSLPLTTLRFREAVAFIEGFASCLQSAGSFATFTYCHNLLIERNRRVIDVLRATFSATEVETVLGNFPPALALRSHARAPVS